LSNPPHIPDAVPESRERSPRVNPHSTVAVIAIHGVGRHLPGASAEALATLLASMGRKDGEADHISYAPPYEGFDTLSIEVPLAPVTAEHPVSPTAPESKSGQPLSLTNDHFNRTFWEKAWGVFDERRGFLAESRDDVAQTPSGSSKANADREPKIKHDSDNFDYLYMLEQLADYEGEPDRSFATFRLDSRRAESRYEQVTPIPDVHIYDAHYSDLSKPESSFVGFFFAFYQLLFHLAGIGLNGVYLAEAENTAPGSRPWPWRIFSWLHASAVRTLTMFIPILNLVVLAIGLSAFVDKLSPANAAVVGYSLAGFLGLTATLLIRKYHRSPSRPIVWAAIPFAGALTVTIALRLLAWAFHAWISPMSCEKWLVVLNWLILAGMAIYFIAKKFADVRTGANKVAIPLYLLNVAFFLFMFLPRASGAVKNEAATAALLAIQFVFAELLLCWGVSLVLALISWFVSTACIEAAVDKEKKCRARAAHRTGRFSFAISASFFLITTLVLWSGIAQYTSKRLHVFDNVPARVLEDGSFARGSLAWVIPKIDDLEANVECIRLPRGATCPISAAEPTNLVHPWDDYLDGLLVITVTPGLPFTLALIVISFLLLVWAAMPSVLFEIWPKRTPPSEHHTTQRAGEWLTHGLDNVVILIRILWFAIVPIPVVFGVLNLLAWHGYSLPIFTAPLYALRRLTLPIIEGAGAIVAVSAAVIVTVILKYGVVILDAILDVDNYLRTVPVEQTPRARIAERVTSLLRYVAAYRDPEGRPYERLIIVAHSLGTLVAADLLRFLSISTVKHPDPVLRPDGLHTDAAAPAIPIYLLTMGSPLRPLLNRFFPHLYEWVTPIPDNSRPTNAADAAQRKLPPEILKTTLPQPDELCVRGWCNAYRSGDYVGRYLWSAGWLKRNEHLQGAGPVTCFNDPSPASRAEMCIGIGAHTHYWDRSAPDVADVLQKLITDPIRVFPQIAAGCQSSV
jgi:hypothetical protein